MRLRTLTSTLLSAIWLFHRSGYVAGYTTGTFAVSVYVDLDTCLCMCLYVCRCLRFRRMPTGLNNFWRTFSDWSTVVTTSPFSTDWNLNPAKSEGCWCLATKKQASHSQKVCEHSEEKSPRCRGPPPSQNVPVAVVHRGQDEIDVTETSTPSPSHQWCSYVDVPSWMSRTEAALGLWSRVGATNHQGKKVHRSAVVSFQLVYSHRYYIYIYVCHVYIYHPY